MAQNDRRKRYLKAKRDRARRSGAQSAQMRFLCSACGTQFRSPMNLMVGGLSLTDENTGDSMNLSTAGARWMATCPRCGERAEATNSVNVVAPDGRSVTGFADTPAQVRAIAAALEDLRRLQQDASLEQIVEVLQRQGDATRPVVDYLVANHLQLLELGAALVMIVIGLLPYLAPLGASEERQLQPAGITQQQMEHLIHDFERQQLATERDEHDRNRVADSVSQAGRDGAADAGHATGGSRRGTNPRQ